MDNKNLPAYPHTSWEDIGKGAAMYTPERLGGLTKLEMVSAMCLQGMLANTHKGSMGYPWEELAKEAAEAANALLTHLSKTEK